MVNGILEEVEGRIIGTVGYGSGVWYAYNLAMILCLDESFFYPWLYPLTKLVYIWGEGVAVSIPYRNVYYQPNLWRNSARPEMLHRLYS